MRVGDVASPGRAMVRTASAWGGPGRGPEEGWGGGGGGGGVRGAEAEH